MIYLYNYSDIYNKELEIKKNILIRMLSVDIFILKEIIKYNYSIGRKF